MTPVQDFEAMMSRRDSPDWVSKAMKNMKNKIFDLVENSYEGDNYPKAVELLVALRKGCILEQVYLSLISLPLGFLCAWIIFAFIYVICKSIVTSFQLQKDSCCHVSRLEPQIVG